MLVFCLITLPDRAAASSSKAAFSASLHLVKPLRFIRLRLPVLSFPSFMVK